MSSGGKTQTQTTVQSTGPWKGVEPYLKKGFQRAEQDILNNPTTPYPNSTVVGFSDQTSDALQMGEDRARAGSDLTRGAQQYTQDVLGGKYMGSNPYLDQAIDTATRPMVENFQTSTMPAIQSGFSGKGRYGSGLQAFQQRKAADDLQKQIGDVSGAMSYNAYNQGMQQMADAAKMAPAMAEADYSDIGKLQQIGGIREEQAKAELQDDINRYYAEQEAGKSALERYMALVAGGSYGGDSTTSQPIYRNKTNEMLGQASTAAGIAGTLFGGGGVFG